MSGCNSFAIVKQLRHTFRRKLVGQRAAKTLKTVRDSNVFPLPENPSIQTENVGRGTPKHQTTLGEIDSLRFTKLGSSIGAMGRLKGLRIAARIVGFKVIRTTKNPTSSKRGNVNATAFSEGAYERDRNFR